MATLPTITINDPAIMQRILTAFGNDPQNYINWLKEKLRERVMQVEFENNVSDLNVG